MAGVNVVGHLHAVPSDPREDDLEVDLGDGTYLHGARILPGGGWVVGGVEEFKIVGEDGSVTTAVYGESLVDIDPPAGNDDDDTMEEEGEEKDEGEEGGAAGDDEARNQETSYMSLSPPLALSHPGILRSQPFAVFKVLAVTGSEGEGLRPYVLKSQRSTLSPHPHTTQFPLP